MMRLGPMYPHHWGWLGSGSNPSQMKVFKMEEDKTHLGSLDLLTLSWSIRTENKMGPSWAHKDIPHAPYCHKSAPIRFYLKNRVDLVS